MKVKDIIMRALVFAGRDDVAKALEDKEAVGGEENEDIEAVSGEENEENEEETTAESEFNDEIRTALLCFNAVEDELARHYIPLVMTEKFSSHSGEIEFTEFSERPVKILSVKNAAVKCNFEILPEKIKTCAGEITVEYNYAPRPKGLDDESVYPEALASISLLAAGTASEFCLISGDAGAANVWETKYRREIDCVQRKKFSGAKLPPRRWV